MARQRGAIIRRGKTYYVKYRTPSGKQKWESGFSNRSQAQQRLNQLLGEIGHGSYVEPKAIRFEKFAEEWLESRVAVRGSTLSSYGSIVRRRLIPYFGKMSLSEIGYDMVQNFVNELAKQVSVKTLHNVIICLRVMLVGKKGASAVKRGFLRHDPTRGIEMPAMDQKQVVPPTREEVWKLVDAAVELGGIGRDMVFIDAFTGLRRNEILALQYTDIDWTNKEVVINKAVSKTKVSDGVRKWEWQIGPPKSRKSNRRVAAADAVLELLRSLRSKAEDTFGLIFRGPEGKRMDPDYFDEFIFGRVAAHAGLSRVRFHDLRHFFASMLIAQGESAKYVCDQMGHSSIQVTFDTYGHLFPNSRETAAKKLQQAMFTGRKKGFGSSLVAKPRKHGKKAEPHGNES
jgi:integrase